MKAHLLYCIAGLFAVEVLCATLLMICVPGDQGTNIAIISGMVTMGAGFLINNFKTQKVEDKLDVNTAVTVAGRKEAKEVAVQAASVAITTAQGVAQVAAETTAGAVAELKNAVNGRMEEMLKLAAEKAYAEGLAAGKLVQKDLQDQLHRHQERNDEHLEKMKKDLADMKAEIAKGQAP